MTEEKAHQFVAHWNDIIFPGRVKTEDEIFRAVARRLLLVKIITIPYLIISFWMLVRSPQKMTGFMWVLEFFILSMFSFAVWQSLRLRQARRLLDKS
jgi:hypothetical protein